MRIKEQLEKIQLACRQIPLKREEDINRLLQDLAEEAVSQTKFILEENKKDLHRMDEYDPKYDRLKLTEQRISDIAADIKNVSSLPNPLGKVLVEKELENGLSLQKVTVPLGVIGIIYEARPNVTFDVFALCIKSGNACVLKGGSDAEFSNKAISGIIKKVLERNGFDPEILQLLPPDREAASELLNAVGYVDILIPRGSQNLINFVRDNARIPVIETGAGICHTYFDEFGDVEKGKEIVFNAKTRRPSVCNSLDCLVIDEKRITELPALLEKLKDKEVEVYADEKAYGKLEGSYPGNLLKKADEKSFGTEFLSLKMSVKTVPDFDSAINHIYKYSSKHSEAIVTENEDRANLFLRSIDAAAVYHNTSTAFTDGAQFGLGAEIGISTQKLHARGPMALEELTSYKWLIKSNGVTRP